MSNIVPFDFNGNAVRVIEDKDGGIWFVAKDVCDILGYTNTTMAVQQHCKHPELFKANDPLVLDVPSRGLTIINEPDLYRLVMRSMMPEAEAFERKVMEEILPSIRKTGSYAAPSASTPTPFVAALDAAPKALTFYELLGLDKNAAAIATNQAIRKVYNQDLMALGGVTHLLGADQERIITPTDIGVLLGGISARQVNRKLAESGFQIKDSNNRWAPTAKGKKYARWFMAEKAHVEGGTPVQQLKWLESVVGELRLYLVAANDF